MQTQIDKQKIVEDIIEAAKDYKRNLVGKTFLYVFDNKCIEVIFKAKDFKHLTGVDTNLSAQSFYKKAYKGVLQTTQIFFSERHPYNLAVRKIKHLRLISSLAMGESFMLKDITTQTEQYKYGTTDLKFSLCFNKEYDDNGIEKGDCFIAKSLRDEDCFSKSNEVFTITHIYSKSNDEKKYNQELYLEHGYSIDDLPEKVREMLSKNLLDKTKQSEITPFSSGNNSNGTQSFSLLPPQNRQLHITPLQFSGQAAGAVALSIAPPRPPRDLFTKIADTLVKGLDNIVHTVSLFAEKINRAFNADLSPKPSAKARRASEKKINHGLPSPKKTPSKERTEPVSAKSEKSSWIAEQLSSAKIEADKRNSEREQSPKTHNKNQSL